MEINLIQAKFYIKHDYKVTCPKYMEIFMKHPADHSSTLAEDLILLLSRPAMEIQTSNGSTKPTV